MKIVVVGGGRVGLAIIRLLLNEQHDITVVESDPERAEFLATTMDVYVIEGRSDVDHLKEAGTAEADLLIAVTPSDENNLIACAVGRKLGAKHTIARVRDEEYYQDMVLLREELGLSMSINPERTAAKEISRCLRFPSAVKVEPFAHRQVELVEYKVSQDSKLCNVVLMDFREKFGDRVLVCTIERDGQVYIPSGKSQIEADDTITLVGAPESIHKLFRQIKEFRHETRNVMLLGGGRLAERLGQELQKLHIRFTVIEKDMKRCMELKAAFPEATIVCADGTQPDVLIEEGLEKMDALVALTESDTTNMVMSSFAKTEGVPQSTTLINEDHFVKMTEANSRATMIQPPKVTAERIVEYVRWMQNSSRSSEIETLRMISDGQAEAVEFVARSDMDVLGVPLKDLPLKSSVLIAAITRGRQCIIPNGNDCIQVGDHVVVVTTRHGMKELSDIMDYSAANDWKLSRKQENKANAPKGGAKTAPKAENGSAEKTGDKAKAKKRRRLNRRKPKKKTPAAETAVTEVPSEAPESAATSPTPTETPTYQIYVTSGSGGDAYATTNTVKDGETDHITVIPDVGYSVGSININGTPSGYYGSFDLTEIHMDTVIHIEFVPMQTEEEAASDNEE